MVNRTILDPDVEVTAVYVEDEYEDYLGLDFPIRIGYDEEEADSIVLSEDEMDALVEWWDGSPSNDDLERAVEVVEAEAGIHEYMADDTPKGTLQHAKRRERARGLRQAINILKDEGVL